MDRNRIDGFAKTLGGFPTRRTLLVLGGAGLLSDGAATATAGA